jgi:hypothetical protein
MAIQFVGGAVAAKVGATSGNTTISLSAGLTGGIASAVSAGDLVIAAFGTGSAADRTLAITDGTNPYTLIASELFVNGTDEDQNLRVAYKFMGSTPDASTTFGPTGNTADAGAMAVYVFRGVDPTTPLDVTPTTATGTGSLRPNPPAITPATAGAFIVCVGNGGGTAALTSSELTGFLSIGSNDTNDTAIGIGHKNDWSSGAFDPAQFGGDSGFLDAWIAMTIALRPDPAPPASSGKIKVWNGSSWVAKPVKVWNGSAWVVKPVKRWSGSAWVTTPY